MKLLDAVNLILPKLGERPVTSLEIRHPTLAVLLPIFDRVRKTTLARGWWFNKFAYTVYPDSDGNAVVGDGCLSFIPDCEGSAIVRGDRLYNPGTISYVFAEPVIGALIQDVAFEQLPESAASYVMYAALVEATTTDLGVVQELQLYSSLAAQAWSDLLTEHLRQSKYSTRKSARWQRILRALGR